MYFLEVEILYRLMKLVVVNKKNESCQTVHRRECKLLSLLSIDLKMPNLKMLIRKRLKVRILDYVKKNFIS